MISFILVGLYLVVGGIGDFARLCPFFLIVTLIILFIAYGLSVQEFKLDNLRPVLGEGFSLSSNPLMHQPFRLSALK